MTPQTPEPSSPPNVVVLPDRPRLYRLAALCAPVFALILAGMWLAYGPIGRVLGFAYVLLLFGPLPLTALRGRITVTPGEIVDQGAFLRRRWPRERIARLVRARITFLAMPAVELVYLLDAAGTRVARLGAPHYTRAEVDRLVRALGVPCTGPARTLSLTALHRHYPGLLAWYERPAFRVAVMIIGSVLAVTVLTVYLWLRTRSL